MDLLRPTKNSWNTKHYLQCKKAHLYTILSLIKSKIKMWLSKGLLGLSAQANSIEDLSSYINNFRESKLAPLWTFTQNNVTTTISFNQMSGPILLQLENLGSLVELYLGGNYFSGTIPSTLSMCLDPHHVYCVCVFCFFFFSFSFFFFFFFFYAFCFRQGTMITIHVL